MSPLKSRCEKRGRVDPHGFGSQIVPLDRDAEATLICRHKNVILIVTNRSKKAAQR